VLPFIAATAIAADVVDPVSTADVRIAVEVVVPIDVDIAATPTTAPAPTATPGGTHGPTNAKRDCAGSDYRSG
jgi:hypothetical protein